MLLYTLEVHAGLATLHLRDVPRSNDLAVARAICDRLPSTVRVLRVNLHSVVGLGAGVRDDIAALVRDWRRERLGHAIVVEATHDGEAVVADRPATRTTAMTPPEAALMATFL